MSSLSEWVRLQAKLASRGTLAICEWDDYRRLQKHFDPEGYKKDDEEASIRLATGYARKLSIEQLEEIIKEKLTKQH